MICILKLNLRIVFDVIDWMSVVTDLGRAVGLNVWFLTVAIGLIIIPVVNSIVQMMRLPK